MERARKTGDPNQDLEKLWNLLKLLKSLWKGSFWYFSEWMPVGDEMPLSCCHRTKVCLEEMYSRVSKFLSIRFVSPFCCTALSLMWSVSSMDSAPGHKSLTIQNICSLTMSSQEKGWAKLNSWFHREEINMHLISRMDFELSAQLVACCSNGLSFFFFFFMPWLFTVENSSWGLSWQPNYSNTIQTEWVSHFNTIIAVWLGC